MEWPTLLVTPDSWSPWGEAELRTLHQRVRQSRAMYIGTHSSISSPIQCWYQAVVCISTPRMYLLSEHFLVHYHFRNSDFRWKGSMSKFGFFFGRNNTWYDNGIVNIFTGEFGLENLGKVASFNYSDHSPFFQGQCGKYSGSPDLSPPYLLGKVKCIRLAITVCLDFIY